METFAGALREGPGLEIDEFLQAEKLFSEALDLAMAEEYDQAIRIILENPDLLPVNERTLTLLGLCYRKQGELELAREVLGKALELDPDNKAASLQLSFLEADERGVGVEEILQHRFKKLVEEARNG